MADPDEELIAEARTRVKQLDRDSFYARGPQERNSILREKQMLEALLRARPVSPVTREALEPLAMMIADFYHNATDPFDAAGEILEALSVSPSAEVEQMRKDLAECGRLAGQIMFPEDAEAARTAILDVTRKYPWLPVSPESEEKK
jgi:hypothetical protein